VILPKTLTCLGVVSNGDRAMEKLTFLQEHNFNNLPQDLDFFIRGFGDGEATLRSIRVI
jgi:hypothetical protein